MGAKYWIKLYIEILNDPKVMTLPDRLFRRMVELFLFAGEVDKGGELPDVRQISWRLHLPVDELVGDLEQLRTTGIIQQEGIGWNVVHFAERQSASSDAERKRASRDRQRRDQYHGVVTDQSRSVRQSREETDTEQKRAEGAPVAPGSRWERIYRVVTNQPTIPFSEAEKTLNAIETIARAIGFDDNQTVEYLRPYFEAFRKKYGQRSTGCFWVFDWAVSGNDPEELSRITKKDREIQPEYRIDVNGNRIAV